MFPLPEPIPLRIELLSRLYHRPLTGQLLKPAYDPLGVEMSQRKYVVGASPSQRPRPNSQLAFGVEIVIRLSSELGEPFAE